MVTSGAEGIPTLQAVYARTLKPVELPEQVRSQPGIEYLAGSPRYLAWSTDPQHAVALRLADGQLTGSEDVIVRTEPLSVPPKGGVFGSAVSSLCTAAAPAIPGWAA